MTLISFQQIEQMKGKKKIKLEDKSFPNCNTKIKKERKKKKKTDKKENIQEFENNFKQYNTCTTGFQNKETSEEIF